jgi:hypothetical protein
MRIDPLRFLRGVVLIMGSLLLVALTLYPPLKVVDRREEATRRTSLGHQPVWRPPTAGQADEVLTARHGPARDPILYWIDISLDVRHAFTEYTAIVATMLGLSFFLGRKARDRPAALARRSTVASSPELTDPGA